MVESTDTGAQQVAPEGSLSRSEAPQHHPGATGGDTESASVSEASAAPTDWEAVARRLIPKLTQIVELYAERAAQPEVVKETSAKEAVSIVKTTVDAIKILQAPPPRPIPVGGNGGNGGIAGRSARVRGCNAGRIDGRFPAGSTAPYSQRESTYNAEICLSDATKPKPGGSFFDDIVTEICALDPEVAHLEPWARLLLKMDSAVNSLEKRLKDYEASRAEAEAAGEVGSHEPVGSSEQSKAPSRSPPS